MLFEMAQERSCSDWSSCFGRGRLRAVAAAVLGKPLLMYWVWQKSHSRASESSCLAIFQQKRFLRKYQTDTKPKWNLPPTLPSEDLLEIRRWSLHACLLLGSLSKRLTPALCWGCFLSSVCYFVSRLLSHLRKSWCEDDPHQDLCVLDFFLKCLSGKFSFNRKGTRYSGFDTPCVCLPAISASVLYSIFC